MNVKQLFLVLLVGLLLVQVALAAPATPKAPAGTKAATPQTPQQPTKQAEPVKAEVPKPADTPKATPPKAETPKAEPPKPAETPKPATPKAEAPKAEAPKTAEVPKPKETPKAEAPKAETPKAEAPKTAEVPKPKAETPKTETPKPKAETPKAEPKATPKTEGKETSFVETYLPIAQDYAQQAIGVASDYAEVAGKHLKDISIQGAALAEDYFEVASEKFDDYKEQVEEITYKKAVETVDQFLDPEHAEVVKKHYLNWYGVGIIVGSLVATYLFVKHMSWLLSITALRAFLTAASLGAYGTLAAITYLAQDPATLVTDKSQLAKLHQLPLYVAVATAALNALAFLALPGKGKSFVTLALSAGLFVDFLDFRPKIEAYSGPIPAYSLEALIFLLQTILVFDSVARAASPSTKVTVKKEKFESKGAAPAYIKTEKEEKVEKGSRKGSKAK